MGGKKNSRQKEKQELEDEFFAPQFSWSRRLRCELLQFQQFTFSSRALSEIKKVPFSLALNFF